MILFMNVDVINLPSTHDFLNMVTSESDAEPIRDLSKMQSPASVEIPDQHEELAEQLFLQSLVVMLANVPTLLELRMVE